MTELITIVIRAITNVIKNKSSSSERFQELIFRPGKIFRYFQRILDKESENVSNILEIVPGMSFTLEASDGKNTIEDFWSNENVLSYNEDVLSYTLLDISNKDFFALKPCIEKSKKIGIFPYKLVKGTNFSEIFNSVSNDLESLYITEDQFIKFVFKYRKYLESVDFRKFYFLLKKGTQYLVISILNIPSLGSLKLTFGVYYFGCSAIWDIHESDRIFLLPVYRDNRKELELKEKLEENKFLSLVLTPKLTLEALDGKRIIRDSSCVFRGGMFLFCLNDNESLLSEEIQLFVYEQVFSGTFKEIFESFSDNLDNICLTQNQIVRFCEKYPQYLVKSFEPTYFLFKDDNQYQVGKVMDLTGKNNENNFTFKNFLLKNRPSPDVVKGNPSRWIIPAS